jgi:hypothetical protein
MMGHKSETPGRAGQGSQTNPNHAEQSVSENSAPVKPWPRWFGKFGAELISVIPHDAESDTIAVPLRGKCPGFKKDNGKWSGRAGALADHEMTLDGAKTAHRTGAVIGMLGRAYPALDIDTSLPALAQEVAELADMILGPAPCRGREGSPRRLLMYRGAGHRKRRLEFRPPGWKEGDKPEAIEWLGDGQYYNVEGVHPSGKPYQWEGEHPCDLGPEGLSEADSEGANMLFEAMPALLERHGCVTAGAPGARKRIGDPSMVAPSPQHVLDLLAATPCAEERFKDRHDIVAWLCGVKAALGGCANEYRSEVLEWFLQYPGAEDAYFDKIWDSIEDAAVGWGWLDSASGAGIGAQVDFEEHPEAGAEDDMPEAPEGVARARALKAMLASTAYCRNIDRFGDTETGDLRNAKAFCVQHKGVADVGLSGTKSADNLFLNHPSAQIVDGVTYRPGEGPTYSEEVNGTRRDAFNTWRGPSLKPLHGATDAEVASGLKHIDLIFGPPGAEARERFLDWCAFNVQRPGVKINYALLLVGPEGVGKDTAVEPLRRMLGPHNTATIDAEAIFEPFNSGFLPRQLLILNEAHSFRTKENMNKLKPLIAAPPHTLMVNRKNVPQYEIPNIVNVVLFSNHEDALAPTQDDRRYWVHRCLIDKKPSKSHFKAFYAWLDGGGDAKLFGWLLARDISQFDHLEPAPMTAAKQEMIDLTQPAPLRWCRELLREGGQFEDRDIVAAREMVRAAERSRNRASGDVNEKWVLAAFRAEGFTKLERIRDGKDLWRLWVRGPSDLLAQLGSDELIKRYREEAGLARWGEASA